jgi:multiple sugar transport system ATP-binding protein
MFVAGFIGSPAMNFIKGKIVESGQDLIVEYSQGRVLLTPEKARKVKESDYVGKEIILGIRPEHIHYQLPGSHSDDPKDAQFDVDVDVVEILGSEQIIFYQFDGVEYAAKAVDTNVRAGDRARLAIDIQKVHIFDADTKSTVTN